MQNDFMLRPRSTVRTGSAVIELLVVAGIMAIMIALMIPILLSANDSPLPKFAHQSSSYQSVSHHSPDSLPAASL